MKRFSILLAAAALLGAFAGCQKEPVGKVNEQSTNSYVSFTINFNSDVTKADYGDGTLTSDGTDAEHDVKFAYLYFFQNEKYVKTIEIASGNITSTGTGVSPVKKTMVPTELAAGAYNVYATLNYQVADLNTSTTEDQYKQKVFTFDPKSYEVSTSGIPMSSRSSNGTMCTSVTLESTHTKDNPCEFSLDMERMVAKIQVQKDATYKIYADRLSSGTEVATATLTGYKAVNLTKSGYVFRHVGETSFGELTGADGAVTNYVVEPTTASKVIPTGTNPWPSIDYYNKVGAADPYTAWTSTDMTLVNYCTENTMPTAEAQYTNFATGIAFAAQLTPATGKYYAVASDNGTGSYTANSDLWYYNDCFYASLEVLNAANGLTLTTENYGKFGVKKFVGGVCYYTYYISHISNGDNKSMGLMEYAIVRNNDYQVSVTKIMAVGEDVPTVKEQPIEMVETYFQATLTVKPWVVREQDAVLG